MGPRQIVRGLVAAGALPPARPAARAPATLPAVLLRQPAHGVGLELQELASPRWAGRSLVVTRVHPEPVRLSAGRLLTGRV